MIKGYIVCVYENIDNNDILKSYAIKAREAVKKYNGEFILRIEDTDQNRYVENSSENWIGTFDSDFI